MKNNSKSIKVIIKIMIPILVIIAIYVALKYTLLYFDTKSEKPIISKDYLTINYKGKTYLPYSGKLPLILNEESGVIPSINGQSLLIRLFEPDYIREIEGVDCLHLKNGHGIEYEIYCVEGFDPSD